MHGRTAAEYASINPPASTKTDFPVCVCRRWCFPYMFLRQRETFLQNSLRLPDEFQSRDTPLE